MDVQKIPPDLPDLEVWRTGTKHWPDQVLASVGLDLHRSRKVTPLDPDQTDESTGYDDLVGITYEPFDLRIAGARFIATPRRIGVREVAGYAKPSCRHCHGVGYFRVTERKPAGHSADGKVSYQDYVYEKTCSCAESRYKRHNRLFLIDSQLGEWIALDNLEIHPAPPE